MVVRRAVGNSEADRHLVEEQRPVSCLAGRPEVVAGEEHKLVGSGCEGPGGKDRCVGAPVGIGDRLGNRAPRAVCHPRTGVRLTIPAWR